MGAGLSSYWHSGSTKREERFRARLVSAASSDDVSAVTRLLQSDVSVIHKDHWCLVYSREAARAGRLAVLNQLVMAIYNASLMDLCCKECADIVNRQGHLRAVSVDYLLSTLTFENLRNQCCILAVESAAERGDLESADRLLQAVSHQEMKASGCRTAALHAWSKGHFDTGVESLLERIADQQFNDQCRATAAMRLASRNDGTELACRIAAGIGDAPLRDETCAKVAGVAAKHGSMNLVMSLMRVIADPAVKCRSCQQVVTTYLSQHPGKSRDELANSMREVNLSDNFWVMAVESTVQDNELDTAALLLQVIWDQSIRELCSQVVFVAALRQDVTSPALEAIDLDIEWAILDFGVLKYLSDQQAAGRSDAIAKLLLKASPEQVIQLLCSSISAGHSQLAVAILPYVSQSHLDVADGSGSTALMLAAEAGWDSLAAQLLDLGASVGAEDREGRTALTRACLAGRASAAAMLAKRGSSLLHRGADGSTCLQLAEWFGPQQLVQDVQNSSVSLLSAQ